MQDFQLKNLVTYVIRDIQCLKEYHYTQNIRGLNLNHHKQKRFSVSNLGLKKPWIQWTLFYPDYYIYTSICVYIYICTKPSIRTWYLLVSICSTLTLNTTWEVGRNNQNVCDISFGKRKINTFWNYSTKKNAFLLQLYLFLVMYVDQCHMGYCGNTTVG